MINFIRTKPWTIYLKPGVFQCQQKAGCSRPDKNQCSALLTQQSVHSGCFLGLHSRGHSFVMLCFSKDDPTKFLPPDSLRTGHGRFMGEENHSQCHESCATMSPLAIGHMYASKSTCMVIEIET